MFSKAEVEKMMDAYAEDLRKSMDPAEMFQKLEPAEKLKIGQALIDDAKQAMTPATPETPVNAIPADRNQSIRNKLNALYPRK